MNIILTIKISFLLILVGGIEFINRPNEYRTVFASRPGITAVNDTTPDPAPHKNSRPAPHNAKVIVEIIDLETDNNNFQLQLKIKEVLGYGASTPILSAGEVLPVNAGTFYLQSNRRKEWIKPGATAVAVISHSPAMEMNSAASNWSITDLAEHNQPE